MCVLDQLIAHLGPVLWPVLPNFRREIDELMGNAPRPEAHPSAARATDQVAAALAPRLRMGAPVGALAGLSSARRKAARHAQLWIGVSLAALSSGGGGIGPCGGHCRFEGAAASKNPAVLVGQRLAGSRLGPVCRNGRTAGLPNPDCPCWAQRSAPYQPRGDSGIFAVPGAAKGLKRACLAPIGALR